MMFNTKVAIRIISISIKKEKIKGARSTGCVASCKPSKILTLSFSLLDIDKIPATLYIIIF